MIRSAAAQRPGFDLAPLLDPHNAGGDRPEVRAFLAAHPDVLTVLDDIVNAIPSFFPPGTGASRAVEQDPDEAARPEDGALFVNLRVPVPYPEALALLRRFNDAWWLTYPSQATGLLVVDVE